MAEASLEEHLLKSITNFQTLYKRNPSPVLWPWT